MKKFLFKIACFAAILVAINALLLSRLPYYWANELFYNKVQAYNQRVAAQPFDVVFWGSSHIYRQVNPAVFDTAFDHQGSMRSFNLGNPGCFNPESYYLYENFLKTTKVLPKYVVMELREGFELKFKNVITDRGYYWLQDYHTYSWQSAKSWQDKLKLPVIMANKYLVPGKNKLRYAFVPPPVDTACLGPLKNGYYALDTERAQLEAAGETILSKRENNFLKDTAFITKGLSKMYAGLATCGQRKGNMVHLKKINSLIALSEKKGVRLIFLCAAPVFDLDIATRCLYDKIPAGNKLDPGFYKSQEYLYQLPHFFDKTHFNSTGADLYSNILAKALSSFIESNPAPKK